MTADALSRAAQISFSENDKEFADVVECHADNVVQTLSASNKMLEQIKNAIRDDKQCKKVIDFCLNGWPKHGIISWLLIFVNLLILCFVMAWF